MAQVETQTSESIIPIIVENKDANNSETSGKCMHGNLILNTKIVLDFDTKDQLWLEYDYEIELRNLW